MADALSPEPKIEAIAAQRVIPVLRCDGPRDAVDTARAAASAGMTVVELTTSIPGALEAVRKLAADGLVVGLGTVREASQVDDAARAGARFVVSFHRPAGLVERAHELGLAAIPGALTPHEIAAAQAEGADAVKVFPAHLVGPDYLADLEPLVGGLRAVATGGVPPTAAGLGEWLRAGALAVGLGSALGTAARDGAAEVARRCESALQVASAVG